MVDRSQPDKSPGNRHPTPQAHHAHEKAHERVGVVIVAAGESRRMAGIDKIFTPLLGLPLIAHTVEVFNSCPLVHEIALVLSSRSLGLGRALAKERGWDKVTSVCQGGERRQDSVRLGLESLQGGETSWVAVHDGARPCLDHDLIMRGLEASRETGASVAAVPAKDTIKIVSGDGLVEATPPRETLWMAQTPQFFRYDLLLQAHRSCRETVTDDATMVEGLGHRVKVFMGAYQNIKVTTPEDLAIAQVFLTERQALLSPETPSGEPASENRLG
jgi:2-C-methyl-D-erythritol 4-phosphate cytidylyltransferase